MEKPKKTQPSRKGTKAWRKNIDMQEMEDFVEQRIQTEMAGGPVEARPDESLFIVDKQGSQKAKVKKQLRIDQILAERSKIPALYAKSRAAPPSILKNGKTKEQMSRHQLNLIRKKADDLRKRGISAAQKRSQKVTGTLDIWDDTPDPTIPATVPCPEYIEGALPKPPKVPDTLKQRPAVASVVPAVEIAHPGASYNPKHEDHQEALQIAYDIEMNRIDKEAELTKEIGNARCNIKLHGRGADVTMDIDLPSEDEEQGEDEVLGSGNEDCGVGGSGDLSRRKTRVERNREKRMKQEQERLAEKAEEKKMLEDLKLLEEIKAEVIGKEELSQKRQEEKQEKMKAKAGITARVSKHPYKPLFPTVQLSEDLSGTLRELKPEGNLFKERINNLEKRNIIDTRVLVKRRRRYKEKEYEKHSYKKFK